MYLLISSAIIISMQHEGHYKMNKLKRYIHIEKILMHYTNID